MSYHGGRSGRGKARGFNRTEELCHSLGLHYPPDAGQVYGFIQLIKADAEKFLNVGELKQAENLYTMALLGFDLCPYDPAVASERHKLLCNRSLVYLRMRRYKDSEQDASQAIAVCPSFIKGYWRGSQAVKGGFNGVQRAMPYLIEGLHHANGDDGTQSDIVTFLTEIFALIPKAPRTVQMECLLNDICMPDEEDVEIWYKVIAKLAAGHHWEGLGVVYGFYPNCPSSSIDDLDIDWEGSCQSVSLGTMLCELQDSAVKSWGEDLATCLIDNGASVDEIGQKNGIPTIHFVVKLSLRIKSLNLLNKVLDSLDEDKQNAQNADGNTALHILTILDKANSDIGLMVLECLLRCKCSTTIVNKYNKKPIDYLKEEDKAYPFLLNSTKKSVEELKKDIEDLKNDGNNALKAKQYDKALKYYDDGIKISQKSKLLYKHAAILYSNCANVHFTLSRYQEALTNAKAAISWDNSYHKGHWWHAKTLVTMGRMENAFTAYVDGFVKAEVNTDTKVNFLMEAVLLLKQIPKTQLIHCCNQLRFLDRELWPGILAKLSLVADWHSMAILIMGHGYDTKSRYGKKLIVETIEELCSGVAGSSNTRDVKCSTVFDFLGSCGEVKHVAHWLDATLLSVYFHGGQATFRSLCVDDNDTMPHAVVRFALITGRTGLFESILIQVSLEASASENKVGDSLFHTITKLRPLPGAKILGKVTEMLINKGLSVMRKDSTGRLPVDYLDNKYPGHIFDLFFKKTSHVSIKEILRLKDEGNIQFKKGQTQDAVHLYSEAINIFKNCGSQTAHTNFSQRDIAVLYGNRSEAFLKLQEFDLAYADAMDSVSFDGHWHKGHLRVGRALAGLGKYTQALKALGNAYHDVDRGTDDKVKVEVLVEMTSVCSYIPGRRRVEEIPRGEGHVWAQACYELVTKGNWDLGAVAFHQYDVGQRKQPHLTLTLKPLCNLERLKRHAWGVDLMRFLLECGSDRRTISLVNGDTYLHAVVRITLLVGVSTKFLQYLVHQYCGRGNMDQHKLDNHGNTVLHTAALERGVDRNKRQETLVLLLQHEVDPRVRNHYSHLAIEYLPPEEYQNRELLRKAFYKENISKFLPSQHSSKQANQSGTRGKPPSASSQSEGSRQQPQYQGSQSNKPKKAQACDICDDLYTQGNIKLSEDNVEDGYSRLAECLGQTHKSLRHENIAAKCVSSIVGKLAESHNPEIHSSLLGLGKLYVGDILENLATKNKWRQLDILVRRYRTKHGSDQLKGFACSLSVVPVIRELSLLGAEDVKLQIVVNLLNSGASLGSDNGQSAIKSAVEVEHFRVVCELVKRGADISGMSVYKGDTPIHAATLIVLEKEKNLSMLEFLLDQYEESHEKYPHLDPEQSDKNGDCLFHLVARAKYNSHVLKVTEALCRRTLSANYCNKDGKLPQHYIIKKNDRRLQFIRLATSVQPSREQTYLPKHQHKGNHSSSNLEELNDNSRPADRELSRETVPEVVKTVSVKEKRRKDIEGLIRLLPDSRHSVFSIDSSPSTKKGTIDGAGDSGNVGKAGKTDAGEDEMGSISEASAVKDTWEDELSSNSEIDDGTVLKANRYAEGNDAPSTKQSANSIDTLDDSADEDSFVSAYEELTSADTEVNNNGNVTRSNIACDNVVINTVDAVTEKGDHRFDTGKDGEFVDKAEEKLKVKTKDEKQAGVVSEQEGKGNDKNVVENVDTDIEEEQLVESDDEEEDQFIIDAQVFDNLEWEVECTAEVWKTLRDRHVTTELKQRIVHKIQLLASGDWQPHLCKKLRNVPATLNLFEAKFSKGRRIIWELAVAFSPRLSETAERRLHLEQEEITQAVKGGRIYSEIIRVWDIVLDHDKIYRSVQRIKKSHQRGEDCIIQKNLRGMKTDAQTLPLGAGKRYPILYAEEEVSEEAMQKQHQEMQRFFPPASSNDTEYHILKFYSFSSILVSHVLQNIETKVDFPFRVTDLEHAIINLESRAPILLLGRSGTGKTTCCMYRLWSQFHKYWMKAREADAPLLPRCVEFVHQEMVEILSEDEEEEPEEDSNTGRYESEGATARTSTPDPGVEPEDQMAEGDMSYDHLHQVFITKNAVLCNEVQKNFNELSHADDLMVEHVQHEDEALPPRLQDVEDYGFPMFVTSRQLLLMLDASIGQPYFFDRKEDGSLKVDIAGWTDLDGPLSFLPLLHEDSDAEDEAEEYIEEEEEVEEIQSGASGKKLKVDPRREITYTVFVEEIWPRIKKKAIYHPSLVWTEIMSFIKGSFEALSKPNGYLEKEEYFKLGRKRAPNFSEERDSIYSYFLKYEHFKKQNSLFDETDLVHDTFRRLRVLKWRPWVIHQIYVDETQDFTQAELCLLIRLCQNPNDMFLTGDTAQSIMRGISFRFSDLRSLFFQAKESMQAMGKTSAVEVPKQVYQLTHNYRSHAGILSLATSILELMVEFFPESFDRLQPDQGLFHGPQPILLESCSFGDLAVLLRGNRRKTSHIEFGAHQAILVVNDAARESIPEELRLGLVLTIYEAKGLEFDDVLLYNFFKDSQANKEWRVVTEYLERQLSQQTQTGARYVYDNLVQIDKDILAAPNRPRPLNFNPNQHKVLNSELKHLYTALTRARVNVWIFDEDDDKRAPMFEYFKARKLVKGLEVEEINEKSLSETVFAEKSNPSDWLKRGEDFMRHSLYTVAAKCFGMGGDHDRETVALAHGQALLASRLKDNPRKMRDEFLYAAELYLECNKPAKAALCLQNAKERELAAELFEKLGQFEKAAEIYRRMKQPRDSSRCYEQLGNFNKALDVLSENENYDMAIDTLRRYNIKIKELERKGQPIPQQLIDHRPEKHYTEEKLSHRAAELFHKYKNEDKMLEAVEKFQHVNDRVEFLRNRGYILQAAKIREANGDLDGAAKMLLMHGWLEEAILMARKTLDEHTIATCLLAKCRYLSHKQGKPETDLAALTSCFNAMAQEAADMFKACGDQDGLGCVLLLQADTSGEDVLISKALQAFQEAKPFENIAGSVACCEWLVNKGKLTEDETLKTVIKGIGHMFNLCIALMYPHRSANMERVRKYEQFYGLHPCSQDKVEIHPKERPLCLGMLPDLFKSKGDKSKRRLEVMKTAAHESVVEYLLKQTTLWLEPLWNKLEARREKVLECENYSMGMECEESGNVDNGCNKLHRAQTKDDFRLMIEADLMLIEFEATVQSGAIYFRKNCPVKLIPAVEEFIGEGERDFSWKYRAVTKLWEDLMPKGGHPFLIDYDSKQLLDHIVRNDKIQGHLRRYLQEKWVKAVKENRRLKCLAVRETDVFLVFQMGFYMFRLNFGREKLDRTPNAEMLKLENELDREISEKKKPIEFKGSMRFYSLMMDPDKYGNMNVQCIARRFADAYEHLISYNPYEAVFSYGKFVKLLLGKMGLDFHDIGLYIMWMEFYAVLAFLVIAKLKSQNFRNFLFVAPSHYISLLKFIGAMLPSHASNKSLVEIVHAWKPSYSQSRSGDGHMQERLKYIAFAVAGFGFREFKMMKILVERCQGEPTLYASIERLLILAMTLVCNISKTVPIENETSLMRMMCHANLPSDAPSRMHQSVRGLQDCNGIADVAGVLMNLLKVRGRGEEMLVCSWKGDRKKDPLEMVSVAASMDLFNSSFFKTEATLNAMWLQHQVEHQDQETMEGMPEVEEQQTEEELRQSRQEKQDQEQRELKIWAVNAIARWYRNIMEVRMSKDVKKPENQAMLSAIKIDETHCGICGVFFEQILKERLKLESSVVVGDESVLNETTVDGASKQRSFETANNPWEKEQEIKPISEEQRRQRMAGIHKAHKKQNSHSQKYQEFHRFKTDYNEVVEPQLKKIREFVYDSGVGLDKPQYVEQHYKRHKMEIERMLRLISQIEQEIHLQITSHRWAGAGRVGQNLTELMTDFQTVEPFVREVQAKLKQDEEDRSRQASSASNGMTMQGRAMSENDDLEDIETVVEEPSVHVRKRDPKPRRKGKQRLHNR
ncbi:TPR and ankyrin repeat-containing protein 1-like [Mya arenaria]|uniref:TPR and ankyrin repeat-containing protein 1-like n=1 Tax=Mya arenaria TaxID=6604 RepID=UPI0022DEEAB0|nr:TPR and ankyrin repeat-containing protein 1-like [Mya arenaria]XP_052783612.1 TPR and ankyrin repeat-containing protein 1-like [Mya arenaria]XP_052783613.1 TPR and ankyrin repeat-containing protein 1-like [Mya arenaria]